MVEKCNKCVPLVRKKAQETAGRNSAEINNQYYLFGCLCHVQTIFSALWGQNQNNKNKNPPNPRKTARRNAVSLKEQNDPDRGDKGGTLVFNAHLSVLSTVVFSVIFTYWPDGGLKKWPCHLVIFPASTQLSFPFTSSSRIWVFFLHEGCAVNDDRARCETGFPEYWFRFPRSLAVCRPHNSKAVIKAAWWSYEFKKKRGGKKTPKATPSLSFLKLKEKLRDGTASSGDTCS